MGIFWVLFWLGYQADNDMYVEPLYLLFQMFAYLQVLNQMKLNKVRKFSEKAVHITYIKIIIY